MAEETQKSNSASIKERQQIDIMKILTNICF